MIKHLTEGGSREGEDTLTDPVVDNTLPTGEDTTGGEDTITDPPPEPVEPTPSPDYAGSSTHRLTIDDTTYFNLSNGNINCALFLYSGQMVRVMLDGVQPLVDTKKYITLTGPRGFIATELVAEGELYCRAEEGTIEVLVIRGPSIVGFLG